MAPRGPAIDKKQPKVAPPKDIKDVPRYLRETVGGFFSRLLYIFRMVWKTGPWILITMLLVCIFTGIFPAIISIISKDILNEPALHSGDPLFPSVMQEGYEIRRAQRPRPRASSARRW